MTPGRERRLAAILAADAVGYSRLVAANEEETVERLRQLRERVGAVVTAHHGRIFHSAGDSVVAEFASPVDSVRCAAEIQREVVERSAAQPDEKRMLLRIGINLGDVVVDGGNLLGDGVNVAARLEALAEPGGILVSDDVYRHVRAKLPLDFADLGTHAVKNLPEPVRVCRVQLPQPAGRAVAPARRSRRWPTVLMGVAAVPLLVAIGLWATWPRPLGLLIDLAGASGPPINPPLPDKPSIVVLPFTNMSGDPEQEYFSDGITEDLITDLSRSPRLFVIARNSAFTYKGRAVNVEDVGRELGVRYVVEGSVRKDSERIRVTAQLIDATTDFHVWSERYDRELADLFSVQSELAEQIMGAVGTEIRAAEIERIRRKPTTNLTAHDLVMRAIHHYMKFTRKDHERARELLERAIELDPRYAAAHAMLSGIDAVAYSNFWSLDPTVPESGRGACRARPGDRRVGPIRPRPQGTGAAPPAPARGGAGLRRTRRRGRSELGCPPHGARLGQDPVGRSARCAAFHGARAQTEPQASFRRSPGDRGDQRTGRSDRGCRAAVRAHPGKQLRSHRSPTPAASTI